MIYIIVGILAFILSLALYPLAKILGAKFKILDKPNKRKVHKIVVPRTGGLVFFVSFWIIIFGLYFINPDFLSLNLILKVFIGSIVVFSLGLIDDKFGLSPYIRLFAQIVVALLLAYLGVRIDTLNIPFIGMFSLITFWSYLLTVFWIVLLINIINWLDGLNGLASGVSLIAFLAIIYTAFLPWVNAFDAAIFAIIMIGILLAFMPFNFLRGNLFMGDSGSNFLGYMLAVTSMLGAAKLATSFLVLGLPIIDGVWVILYRLRHGKSIFLADKNHFHHRLLRLGLNQRQVAIIFWLFSLIFGLLVITASTQVKLIGLIILIVACVIFFSYLDIIEKRKNYERT